MGRRDWVGAIIMVGLAWVLGKILARAMGFEAEQYHAVLFPGALGWSMVLFGIIYFFGIFWSWPTVLPLLAVTLKPGVQNKAWVVDPQTNEWVLPWFATPWFLNLLTLGLGVVAFWYVWRMKDRA